MNQLQKKIKEKPQNAAFLIAMIHNMNVKTKYYKLLKSGIKTIELRLYDEKRKKIKVKDEILFSDTADVSDNFKAVVIALHKAEDFNALCDRILPVQAGFTSKEELINTLNDFYTPEKQQQFGVVGIEVKKI